MRTPDSAASRASERVSEPASGRVSGRASGRLSDVDRRVLTALRRCGDGPHIGRAARALSWSGEHGAAMARRGARGRRRDRPRGARAWLRATALVGAAHLASMGVKRIVRRPRPTARRRPW